MLLACRVVGTATYGADGSKQILPALVTDRALHYPNGELARPSVRDLADLTHAHNHEPQKTWLRAPCTPAPDPKYAIITTLVWSAGMLRMTTRFLLPLSIFTIWTLFPADRAHAAEAHRLPAGCDENELTLSRCLQSEVEALESRLAQDRDRITAKFLPEQLEPFEAMEAAWFEHRNATCNFDSALASGNSRASRYSFCRRELTLERTQLLERYLSCLDGGCGNDFRIFLPDSLRDR